MENYKEELKKIKEALEVIINESEKPQFEVGKWYKGNESTCVFSVLFYCTKVDGDKLYGYGLINNNWTENSSSINIADNENECVEATPKEVEEALTKEAVKRGFKEGVKVKGVKYDTLRTVNNPSNIDFWMKDNVLWMDADTLCNSIDIFRCGVWGEVIKTKTIEELVNDIVCEYPMQKFSLDVFIKQYLTENKQEIIETLNNL